MEISFAILFIILCGQIYFYKGSKMDKLIIGGCIIGLLIIGTLKVSSVFHYVI